MPLDRIMCILSLLVQSKILEVDQIVRTSGLVANLATTIDILSITTTADGIDIFMIEKEITTVIIGNIVWAVVGSYYKADIDIAIVVVVDDKAIASQNQIVYQGEEVLYNYNYCSDDEDIVFVVAVVVFVVERLNI